MRARLFTGNDQFSGGPFSRSKLTAQQRDEIRRRYIDGETAPALAKAFGVSASTIRFMTNGSRR